MAAASTAVRDLLCGPVTAGTVVGALRGAVYVRVGPGRGRADRVVAVVARDAVRVPVAVLSPQDCRDAGLASVAVGSTADVGGGGLRILDRRWAVSRWFDPAVALLDPMTAHPALARLVAAPAPAATGVTAAAEAAFESALEGLMRGGADEPVGPAVRALLGLGEGLTPEGDDVLAGALALVAAVGVGGRARSALATAVDARLGATTTVSAALLREALRGNVIPQVANLLSDSTPSMTVPGVADLLAVGHTSGAAMLRGLALAARVVLATAQSTGVVPRTGRTEEAA